MGEETKINFEWNAKDVSLMLALVEYTRTMWSNPEYPRRAEMQELWFKLNQAWAQMKVAWERRPDNVSA